MASRRETPIQARARPSPCRRGAILRPLLPSSFRGAAYRDEDLLQLLDQRSLAELGRFADEFVVVFRDRHGHLTIAPNGADHIGVVR